MKVHGMPVCFYCKLPSPEITACMQFTRLGMQQNGYSVMQPNLLLCLYTVQVSTKELLSEQLQILAAKHDKTRDDIKQLAKDVASIKKAVEELLKKASE